MISYHLQSPLLEEAIKSPRYKGLSEEEHVKLYAEIRNAILQGIEEKILALRFASNVKPCDRPNDVRSLLLWVLNLTDQYPEGFQKIKSPGSYADFDVDFSKARREEVYGYLAEKYGANRVTHVCTFGKMAAKAAIKNAARALGYPVEVGTALTKHVPNVPDIKLDDVIAQTDFLKSVLAGNEKPEYKHVLETALKLEGLPNSIGTNASACVISKGNLTDYIPLMLSKKDNVILSQYEYKDVEAIGCLKWDILGLKTLDVIQGTIDLIQKRHSITIDMNDIDINEKDIYDLICNGHNTGIFQFESGAALSFVKQVQPQNINEVSDLTSLLRPGPLSMGMMDQYTNAKFRGDKYTYNLKDQPLIEKVWEICSTSYGLLVYQEQVIRCFTEIAGFNEIEGDNARRAMGKKKADEMTLLKEMFIQGGAKLGYDSHDLEELFRQIEGFSGYGFNKSHAVCYSYLTCQTAWLSSRYPLEFFATLLTIDAGKTNDVRRYIKAVKDRGFTIEAPDLNHSDVGFKIQDSSRSIIFGLSGIKGVGTGVSNKILKRRPKKGYKSFGEFIMKNIDLINKKVLEQYAKSGAFRCFGLNKETVLNSVDSILGFLGTLKDIEPYHSMLEVVGLDIPSYINKYYITHSNNPDSLKYEVETLGMYITKHPMEDYLVNTKVGIGVIDIVDDPEICDGTRVHTVGAITSIEVRKTKSKANMASFDLTTADSSIRCIMFPATYAKEMDKLEEGKLVAVKAMVKEEGEGETATKELSINEVIVDMAKSKILTRIERFKNSSNKYDNIRWFRNIDEVNPDTNDLFGIIVNPDLSYILKKES